MSHHTSGRLCFALAALLASIGASAGCGHNHKGYAQGAITCVAHEQFQCGEHGAWRKVPGRCDADPPPPKASAGHDSPTPPKTTPGTG